MDAYEYLADHLRTARANVDLLADVGPRVMGALNAAQARAGQLAALGQPVPPEVEAGIEAARRELVAVVSATGRATREIARLAAAVRTPEPVG